MDKIKVSKRIKLNNPCFIAAWPGMGEVAFKAAKYLVETLKAEEFARIISQSFFYSAGAFIQEGVMSLPELPQGVFYYWKNKTGKNDLIIFLSNAQPDMEKAEKYCEEIISFIKGYKIKLIYGFAAIPQPIDHTQPANIWVASTAKKLINTFQKQNLNILSSGQINGMNGLFLGIAKTKGVEGACLLGEIPLYTIQIENPKAAYAVLKSLSGLLDIRFDLSGLLKQAQVMETEINKLMDYLKLGGAPEPIGDEEIDKIKKTLSQLTQLPTSVKEKIDKLFIQAKTDISKANELKAELDKWNIYREYEDKFLDLFKKKDGQGN